MSNPDLNPVHFCDWHISFLMHSRPLATLPTHFLSRHVLSIVIELPTAQLTAGGNTKLGLWGTTSR